MPERDVPMRLDRTGPTSARVRLGADTHVGMDVVMDYVLVDERIDHVITITPRIDIAEATCSSALA